MTDDKTDLVYRPRNLSDGEKAGAVRHLLRPYIHKDAVEFDSEEMDVFIHGSGHTTRPTGKFVVSISGVPKDVVEKIKKIFAGEPL